MVLLLLLLLSLLLLLFILFDVDNMMKQIQEKGTLGMNDLVYTAV